MPASRLRRLRALFRSTASPESMERLNDIPLRPQEARPRPSPAMVMAPDKSRFQRHSAHLRTRIIRSGSPLPDSMLQEAGDPVNESAGEVDAQMMDQAGESAAGASAEADEGA